MLLVCYFRIVVLIVCRRYEIGDWSISFVAIVVRRPKGPGKRITGQTDKAIHDSPSMQSTANETAEVTGHSDRHQKIQRVASRAHEPIDSFMDVDEKPRILSRPRRHKQKVHKQSPRVSRVSSRVFPPKHPPF